MKKYVGDALSTHELAKRLLQHEDAHVYLFQVDQDGESVINSIENCSFWGIDGNFYIEGKVEIYGFLDPLPEGRSTNLNEKREIYARQIGCAHYKYN